MAYKLREDMDSEEYKEWYEGHKESVSIITRGHPKVWKLLVKVFGYAQFKDLEL